MRQYKREEGMRKSQPYLCSHTVTIESHTSECLAAPPTPTITQAARYRLNNRVFESNRVPDGMLEDVLEKAELAWYVSIRHIIIGHYLVPTSTP